MTARKLTSTVMLYMCALVSLLAFAAGSAQALVTHEYLPGALPEIGQGVPVTGPHGEAVAVPGPLNLAGSSMAIDSGHLWIAEVSGVNGSGNLIYRVDEFDTSTGVFLSQLAHSEGAPRYGGFGLAVGHAGGKGEVYVGEDLGSRGEEPAVAAFEESGATQKTWTGAGTPAGSFGNGTLGDVAVDGSSNPLDEYAGDVYVTVPGQGVIDIFKPEADGEEHYVAQITTKDIAGFAPGETLEPGTMAVSEANGDVVVLNQGAYDILAPAGLGAYTLVGKITGTPNGPLTPFNVALDGGNGEIYLVDGFDPTTIDEFSSSGAYLGLIRGEDTPAGLINDVYSLAVDPQSHDVYVGNVGGPTGSGMDVFGPDVVTPDVTTGPASSVTPTSATFNGTVNPQDAGQATCRFEWGTSKLFGEVAPCQPEAVAESASPVPVRAALSSLQPDTTYYYRLQADNHNGTNPGEPSQDAEFTTPGPGIRHESVSDVASTSVTFNGTVDPHGAPASYYFQYGTSTAYGNDVPAAPGEAIGSGSEAVEVHPYHVQGLTAGTVYHYRVVVISEAKPGQLEVFDGADTTFTTQTAAVSTLPDGRHWEMVSTPDKKGASIAGDTEESGVLQVAAAGDAIAYMANAPTEAEPAGNANDVQVLSSRGPAGWGSIDIGTPRNRASGTLIGGGQEYRYFSEDLSAGILQPFGPFEPQLSSEASEQTPYIRALSTSCGSSCYRALVTGKPGYANVPPGTAFASAGCSAVLCGPFFVGATADLSHVLLKSSAALVQGAGEGGFYGGLYEWAAGRLALVSVLPGGEPSSNGGLLGDEEHASRRAISSDGSRVFWESPNSALYMRDMSQEKTVQLDAPEPACAAEQGRCAGGNGKFQIASVDASKAFFTTPRRLTRSAEQGGNELYECEILEGAAGPECKLSDLTPARVGESMEVQGAVLGASEDGSYLYFVANGVLAEKAIHGTCGAGGEGECNLYVRHDGVTKLIAVLPGEDGSDWSTGLHGMTARVSSDGRWLAFMSHASLTGYDNRDAVSGRPDAEVYLYDASSGRVVCASCNPDGARPLGVQLYGDWVASSVPGWLSYTVGSSVYQPRYLSDGGRLFFDSTDALVPQDVNGVEDVYEYEPAGTGDCSSASPTFGERSGGCVGLISAGTSPEGSEFLDASESGGDVFFLTASKLVLQDYDEELDVYDAHECTSSSPCFPAEVAQPPACTTAEACRAAPAPQPAVFGSPSSATFSGAGNITPEAPSGGSVRKKSLTRSQKLGKALRKCQKSEKARKKARAKCEKRARARYGAVQRRGASAKKGKR